MYKKLFILIIFLPSLAFATPISWDGNFSSQILQPWSSFSGAAIHINNLIASSTTAASSFLANVGIGTSTPQTKLDIVSGSNLSALRIRGTDENIEIADLYLGTQGALIIDTRAGSDTGGFFVLLGEDDEFGLTIFEGDGSGLAGFGNLYLNNTSDDYYLSINVNSVTDSDALNITDTNRVGIGTSSPSQKLTIEGTMDLREQSSANTDTEKYGQLWVKTATPNQLFFTNDAGTDTRLDLGVIWDNTTDSPNISFIAGDVGIGRTTPDVKLDIDSGSNTDSIRIRGVAETTEIADLYVGINGEFVIDLTAGNDAFQFFDIKTEDTSFGVIIRESDGTGLTPFGNIFVKDETNDYMNFTVNVAATTAGLVITEQEFVGVGTSTPQTRFEVVNGTSTLPLLTVSTAFDFLGTYIDNIDTWFNGLFDTQFATKEFDELNNVATMTEAEGDILVYVNGKWDRLASSTANKVLAISDTTGRPEWATNTGASLWSAGTGDDIFYNTGTPQVGIGTGSPTASLHVGTVASSGTWLADTNFTKRMKVTVQSSKVPSDLTDYPVYVNLADLGTDFFDNVNSDGGDIRVTTSDKITQIPRQVVAISTGSKTGELHFKVSGTLASTTNTDFYVYYGNSGASEPAADSTNGSENVWTRYGGVYHNEDADPGITVLDSTSNDKDMTDVGSMTSADSVTGKIGKAFAFDGDDGLFSGTLTGFDAFPYVMEAWATIPSSASVAEIITGIAASTGGDLKWIDALIATDGKIQTRTVIAFGDFAAAVSSGTHFSETIHVVAVQVSATDREIYINGVSEGTNATSKAAPSGTLLFNMGFLRTGGFGDTTFLNGTLDEVRYSNDSSITGAIGSLGGSNFIQAQYNNQATTTSFYATTTQEVFMAPTDLLWADLSVNRVGIGTVLPTTKLDIEGTASSTGLQVNGAGTFIGDLLVDITTFFVDSTTNLIGMGTTTPNEELHISRSQNANTFLKIENSLSGTAAAAGAEYKTINSTGIFFAAGSDYTLVPIATNRFSIASGAATLGLFDTEGINLMATEASADIRMYTGGFADSDLGMIIASNRNVGIGTSTTPLTLLHLISSTTPTLYIESTVASEGGRIILEDTDGLGCSSIVALNGVLTVATVTCP